MEIVRQRGSWSREASPKATPSSNGAIGSGRHTTDQSAIGRHQTDQSARRTSPKIGRSWRQGQDVAVHRAGQRKVVKLAGAPGFDLVGVVGALRLSGRTGDFDGPEAGTRIGEVGDHAVAGAEVGAILSIVGAGADRRAVARDREAAQVEQRSQIAAAREGVLLHERVHPAPGPAIEVGPKASGQVIESRIEGRANRLDAFRFPEPTMGILVQQPDGGCPGECGGEGGLVGRQTFRGDGIAPVLKKTLKIAAGAESRVEVEVLVAERARAILRVLFLR